MSGEWAAGLQGIYPNKENYDKRLARHVKGSILTCQNKSCTKGEDGGPKKWYAAPWETDRQCCCIECATTIRQGKKTGKRVKRIILVCRNKNCKRLRREFEALPCHKDKKYCSLECQKEAGFSEEHKKNLKIAQAKRFKDPKERRKQAHNKGKKFPIGEYPNSGTRGKKFTIEEYPNHGWRGFSKEKWETIRLKLDKIYKSKEYHEKRSIDNKIVMARPGVIENLKKKVRKKWADPSYRKMMAEALHKKPNNLEQFFDELTPKCVKYVGNFSYWITTNKGSRNPDFIIEKQRKVIELFGDFWHKGENPEEKIEEYAEVNWNCKVFWESEVNTDTERVLEETLKFVKD